MKPTPALIAALSFMLASLNAFAIDPHVEAVTRTVLAAKGKVAKTEAISEGEDLTAAKSQSAAMLNAKGSLTEAVAREAVPGDSDKGFDGFSFLARFAPPRG